MTTGVGTGSTITFTTQSGYRGEIKSFNIDGEEVPVIDVSGMTTTGWRKKKFGVLKEPPEVTVELVFDDDELPPAPGLTDTCLIIFPGGGSLGGTGAFIRRSISVELEADMSATYVFKFDGVTGPTYAAGS